jgi:hypothetical protein
MGLLLVATAGQRRALPLPVVCLVGRGPSCFARIDHVGCPAHWIELRWLGDGWGWRALNAEERTRGTGPFLADGWRRMEVGAERGTRVTLTQDVWVELIDAGPPEPFVWDVDADAPVPAEALDTVVERRGDALIPLAAEGDPAHALRDGQCWTHAAPTGPRILRAHVPTTFPGTLATRMDLARGGVLLELQRGAGVAVFSQGAAQVRISGQCVRTLSVYARARLSAGGWLTAAEAWAAWSELGGAPSAPVDAVAWDRTRLRQLLHRARVGSVEALFTQRKDDAYVRVRLGEAIEDVTETD